MHLRYPVQASASKVWKELSDFGAIAHWSPDIAMSTQIARRGIKPGAVRELTFAKPRAGIRTIRERITHCGDHWFTYVIDGGFGPFKHAGSTWRVHADGEHSIIEVTSFLEEGTRLAMVLRPRAYVQLKRGLRRALGCLEARLA